MAAVATAGSMEASPAKYRINLTKEQAPAHVTYPYVLRGYRAGGDYRRCAAALFELHTETFNAWTMLAGGALSAACFAAAAAALPVAQLGPFAALTAAVLLHMPFSVAFHLFRCISPGVYNLWRRLDQIFIFIASILLALGLSWHVYGSAAGVAANTGAAAVVAVFAVREIAGLPAHYQRPRGKMVAFVGSIVAIYLAPMMLQAARDVAGGNLTPAAGLAAATFGVLQAGGWVFAAGWPEKAYPGVFDVVGFSHQLMHVAAVVAHLLEYAFVWEMHCRRAQLCGGGDGGGACAAGPVHAVA